MAPALQPCSMALEESKGKVSGNVRGAIQSRFGVVLVWRGDYKTGIQDYEGNGVLAANNSSLGSQLRECCVCAVS